MKISFCSNYGFRPISKERLLQGGYVKMPKMSDAEVYKSNETKRLPEGSTFEFVEYKGRFYRSYANVVQKKTNPYYGVEQLNTNIIPEGFVIENYKGKTYIKAENVDIEKKLKNQSVMEYLWGVLRH